MLTVIAVVVLFVIMVVSILYFSGKARYDEITGKGHEEIGKEDD